jgi:hypothetical protein
MYSERKLIRLFESIHCDDLARHHLIESHKTNAEFSTKE